jgi:hypothetical protein
MSARVIPLEQIPITSPCPLPDGVVGEKARLVYCGACGKHVHNLSRMTADEARRAVCESAGPLCVQYWATADGKVQTLDYRPSPRPRYRWKVVSALATIGAVAGTAVGAVLHRSKPPAPPVPVTGPVMLMRGEAMAPPLPTSLAPAPSQAAADNCEVP